MRYWLKNHAPIHRYERVSGHFYTGCAATLETPSEPAEFDCYSITIKLPNGARKDVSDLLSKDCIECIEESGAEYGAEEIQAIKDGGYF